MVTPSKVPPALGAVGSVLGLIFASYSSVDYAQHLDRRLHDVHCSLIPGLALSSDENPCRAAMYSVYSAVLRQTYWGGIPVALFAIGAFAFFAGFSIYLLFAGATASRKAHLFYAAAGSTPLLVSLVMFTISLLRLGSLCKTCVGIYISSLLLAAGAWLAWRNARRAERPAQPDARVRFDPYAATEVQRGPAAYNIAPRPAPMPTPPSRGWLLAGAWLALLGASTLLPAVVYAAAMPDERPYLRNCGKLDKPTESHGALLRVRTSQPLRPATLFEDPLCPTCKAFHQRIVDEGVFDKLDARMALFPLDSECNWMLKEPLHPGACLLSRAVICGGDSARQVLEWAYDDQEKLAELGRAGIASLRGRIVQRWGQRMADCLDSAATKLKLNQQLHFAADNGIPVSTPQLYLGDQRICDEDTDLGLRYTLGQIAPELLP